jgi:hypothetical protein
MTDMHADKRLHQEVIFPSGRRIGMRFRLTRFRIEWRVFIEPGSPNEMQAATARAAIELSITPQRRRGPDVC